MKNKKKGFSILSIALALALALVQADDGGAIQSRDRCLQRCSPHPSRYIFEHSGMIARRQLQSCRACYSGLAGVDCYPIDMGFSRCRHGLRQRCNGDYRHHSHDSSN